MRHPLFISRTVLVKNNDVEEAARLLNRILGHEGVIKDIRRLQYYEKPCQVRRRVNFERCKAIYHEDLSRKVNFLMRKNRTQPFPGCY